MLLWLSQHTTVEVLDSIPNSLSIPYNHKHWVVAFTTPMYSAYVDESEIALCILIEQLIGPSASINIYLEFDFLSILSPSQSESVKPTNSRIDCAT